MKVETWSHGCAFAVLFSILLALATEASAQQLGRPNFDAQGNPCPKPKSTENPTYPRAALKMKLSGPAIVQIAFDLVKGDPSPHNARVVFANAPGVFDKNATYAFRKWTYDAEADQTGCIVEMQFSLK